MEFTNEIFFDKNLIENETIIVTYCGKLYREHSSEISIVFGFGDNWENTQEIQMKEKENGFEATITLMSSSTFNFCFKNNYNIWDNNCGFNYITPISPKPVQDDNSIIDSQITTEETSSVDLEQDIKKPNDLSISDDNKDTTDIQEDLSTEETETDETNEEESQDDNSKIDTNKKEDFEIQLDDKEKEIETVFSSLLDSILDMKSSDKNETININDLSGFGLQSVDEIKEEDFVNCDEIFKDFYDELSTVPVESIPQNFETSEEDLDNLFIALFEEKNKDEEVQTAKTEDLDYLMDNILNSIVSPDQASNIELTSPIEKIATSSKPTTEVSGLLAVKEEGLYEKIVDASYALFKTIGTACKKIGSLIKLKAQEFGIIKEK